MKRNVPSNAGSVVLEGNGHEKEHDSSKLTDGNETASGSSHSTNHTTKKQNGVPIVHVDHIPEHRKIQFVLKGYRGHERSKQDYEHTYEEILYSASLCFRSLFYIHNETVNVWSHLIPGLIYLYIAFSEGILFITRFINGESVVFLPSSSAGSPASIPLASQLMIAFYSYCCAQALLGSAIFHLFNPHSHKAHFMLRVVDFSGVSFLTIGSQWPLMYFGFYCSPDYNEIYSAYSIILILLSIFGVSFPLFKVLHAPRFRNLRIGLYVVMAAFPVAMLAHCAAVGLLDQTLELWLNLGKTYAFYIFGLFFYASRIPERIAPGHFDIWFNSHHFWHFLALAGTYTWYVAVNNHMYWRAHNPCVQ